jgi:hypothetical protein
MLSDEELSALINESELLMEGLNKSFWRLIKLSEPEIWENKNESGSEHLWIVAIMGNWCIFHSDSECGFCIGRYKYHGTVEGNIERSLQLHHLILNIVGSRFKIS